MKNLCVLCVLCGSLLFAAEEPLIRDMKVGYLLNCSFLSPQPYCWPAGKDAILSGWEVDRAGGNIAFSPNCHYPDGFAFHSDWFKLVDTSPTAAVTIKHKIARQTEGQIVLEFRFKLPAKMDGACFQLRDLEVAPASLPAVGIITKDGNICYETPDGPKILQPCEPGHDYGVKVVVDISARTADIYIDGEEKGKALPFSGPAKTIDYVLIKTGDKDTGEMFLGPVNIHKGYIVNETFVTCAPGKVPAGWEITGGTVQAFECCTRPDIYSIKLGAKNHGGSLEQGWWWRPKGKYVVEFRMLIPETKLDRWLHLTNIRVGIWNGSIRVENDGKEIELVPQARLEFWYTIKLVIDPDVQAEVFVNGKSSARFRPGAPICQHLSFLAESTIWLDDIRVYPNQDYPADYVPEPKPCPAKEPYLLGVQSCNLWQEGMSYAGWDYVYPFRDKRRPYLGWYDEGNPEETDWEIKWQVEHGIGFEMHCWYRPNNAIGKPIKEGVLDQGIIKGLFNARYSHLAKFAIMCTDEGACFTNMQDWRENIIPYWIEYFFKDPRYLKIDGKPVLSIYHLGNLQKMFGGADGCRKAIEALREDVAKAGLPGIIVLMENRTADRNSFKAMKSIGVDYCYAYTWTTPDAAKQRANNLAQRDASAATGFNALPSISMGWDRQAWGVKDGGWTPVDQYKQLAQWAKDEFMPSLPADSLGRRILMLANWNEFGEGHFLMPSNLAGFGYVDALRDVFTAGGPHEDAKPTEKQTQRFGVLYPRD
ncbi:MAG TPA: glycoside hydrolase family 99-like domain-containing protein [Planctomycetota bacterium]|jgi:hypothetical protein